MAQVTVIILWMNTGGTCSRFERLKMGSDHRQKEKEIIASYLFTLSYKNQKTSLYKRSTTTT